MQTTKEIDFDKDVRMMLEVVTNSINNPHPFGYGNPSLEDAMSFINKKHRDKLWEFEDRVEAVLSELQVPHDIQERIKDRMLEELTKLQ